MNIANESPSMILPEKSKAMPYTFQDGTKGVEYDIGPYQVCVRFDWINKDRGDQRQSLALIQVCRADGGSVMDWRDLQQIKNQIVGPEWEAVELFPAESRLKDPSNARYLWCAQGRMPFGLPGGRMVLDAHESFATQRPFPKEVP